jgi:hypothetical protein
MLYLQRFGAQIKDTYYEKVPGSVQLLLNELPFHVQKPAVKRGLTRLLGMASGTRQATSYSDGSFQDQLKIENQALQHQKVPANLIRIHHRQNLHQSDLSSVVSVVCDPTITEQS